ncbi:MAG: NACHT domain-containing protein [Alphaproteobacteria bacterium]|nr:NACHT domain-containing protein [Alphaproteobacteria bacterium]
MFIAFAGFAAMAQAALALPARAPVWSDQLYLNRINDIEAAATSGFLAGDNGLMLRTLDSGASWGVPLKTHTTDRITLVIADTLPSGATCVAAQTDDGFLATFDDGDHWRYYPLKKGESLTTGRCARDQPGTAWFVTAQSDERPQGPAGGVRLLITEDSGQSWKTDRMIKESPGAIRPLDASTAWATRGNAVIRTVNGGQDWTVVATLPLAPGEAIGHSVWQGGGLAVTTTKNRLFAVSTTSAPRALTPVPGDRLVYAKIMGTQSVAINGSAELYRSQDIYNGQWQKIPYPAFDASRMTAWPDGTVMWLTSHGDVKRLAPPYKATTPVFEMPVGLDVQKIVAVHGGRGLAATGSGDVMSLAGPDEVWKTIRIAGGDGVTAIAMNDAGIALAGTSTGLLFRSTDFGQTWHPPVAIPQSGAVRQMILLRDGSALADVGIGNDPIRTYSLFHLDADGQSWQQLMMSSGDFVVLAERDGMATALRADGTVLAADPSLAQWRTLSNDIAVALRGQDEVHLNILSWLDAKTGLVAGNNGLLFKTVNGGINWKQIELEGSKTDIDYVHCLDVQNCVLHGTYDENDETGNRYLTSSDGGETWTAQRVPVRADWNATSIASDGTGLIATSGGYIVTKSLAQAPELKPSVTQSTLGTLEFRLAVPPPGVLMPSDVSTVTVLVRYNGKGDWFQVPIDKKALSQTGKALAFEMRPGDLSPSPMRGTRLDLRLVVNSVSGVTTTMALPPEVYLSWLARYHPVIVTAEIFVLTIAGVLACFLAALYLAPLFLLRIARYQDQIADAIGTLGPIALGPWLRQLLLGAPIRWMATRDRAVAVWAASYRAGEVQFKDLSDDLLERFLDNPVVMDAWVARHLVGCRRHIERVRAALGAAVYVPMSVAATRHDGEEVTVPTPTAKAVRELVGSSRAVLGIIGEGGMGKTTLACQIATWFMREEPEERILESATALVGFLSGNVDDLVGALRDNLAKAFPDDDPLARDPRVLKAALQSQRLVLIFDGLSEASPQTQERIENVFGEFSRLVLVITSRQPYPHIVDQWSEFRPQQITTKSVNRFVSQYVYRSGIQDADPAKELAVSAKLMSLIERRPSDAALPPVFVTLFIKEAFRVDELEDQEADRPPTISATVQRYVRTLKPGGVLNQTSGEQVVRIATALARLSLGSNFVPTEFDRTAAAEGLAPLKYGADEADKVVEALLEANLLIGRLTGAGALLRFQLDPVAEYLVAAYTVRTLGGNFDEWRKHVAGLAGDGGRSKAGGYLAALRETLITAEGRPDQIVALFDEVAPRPAQAKPPVQPAFVVP